MPLAAIISKPQKAELGVILPELRAWLHERGWSCLLDEESAAYFAEGKGTSGEASDVRGELAGISRPKMAEHRPELVIVLGGDGTLLAAARAFAKTNTPLLSVNLGSLGFLTEVPLNDLYATFEAWCVGKGVIEERSLMRTEMFREGVPVHQWDALNDVVVAKGTIARMADFTVEIDNQLVANFSRGWSDCGDSDGFDRVQPGCQWADRDADGGLHGGDADLPAPVDDSADRGAGCEFDQRGGGGRAERDLPDRRWAGGGADACGATRCTAGAASTACGCWRLKPNGLFNVLRSKLKWASDRNQLVETPHPGDQRRGQNTGRLPLGPSSR